MAEDSNSEISFETNMYSSPSVTQEPPECKDASEKDDGDELKQLCSLVTLLEKMIFLAKHDGEYVIAEHPTTEKWKSLLKSAHPVECLQLNMEEKRDIARISPSVFVRLAQQLKGGFLFPNLRDIHIKHVDLSTHYISLLVSPLLEKIALEVDPAQKGPTGSGSVDTSTRLAIHVFLGDLVTFASNLQSVTIKNAPGLRLDNITRLRHLRVLELTSIVVESFEDLRLLGSLANLESLLLSPWSPSYERSGKLTPRDPFLPSLKRLNITGAFDLMMDLILTIGSESLEAFCFDCTRGIASRNTSSVNKVCKSKKGKKGKKGSPLSEEEAEGDRSGHDADFLSHISSRWAPSLKEITIIASSPITCDLTHIISLRVLEKFYMTGGPIEGVQQTFDVSSTLWCCMQSLYLQADFSVSFFLLQNIACSAPFLTKASLALNIDEDFSTDGMQVIFHPLVSLSILGRTTNGDWMSHYEASGACRDDNWPQLMKVARYLNALFSKLQHLDAMVDGKRWNRVWQMVKLCQDSCADEKRRKPIQEQFEIV